MEKASGQEYPIQKESAGKYRNDDKEEIEYIKEEHCISGKISAAAAKREQLAWNMMENNHIYGLASFDYYYMDDLVCFRYDISAYKQLSEFMVEKEPDFEQIFFLCRELVFIIEKSSEYLLKQENFLLRPEWIFCDMFQKKMVLCYLPGRKKQERAEILLFLEFLMEHMNHKNHQIVEFIYGLYDLAGMKPASAEELLDFIDSWGGKAKKIENTGENVAQKMKCKATEHVWLLGRGLESDIYVPVMTVSRKHLQIIQNEEGCFVMDLSSKNGTRLNGKRLLPMQRVKCTENDILCTGSFSFSLHIAPSQVRLYHVSVNSSKILQALQKSGF